MTIKRKYPIGAEIIPQKGVHFRVFASSHKKLDLVLENENAAPVCLPMKNEKNGYFSLLVSDVQEGAHYRYKIKDRWFSDPASRFQPLGYEGPSQVVSPFFPWTDKKWPGIQIEGKIIYEMHIGTFTEEGTFKGATNELPELAALGITLIEIMPINDFPGQFGWGYDGVNLFAPKHQYGKPEEVKRFIDKAHELGIGVVLDVVYNHLGPEGNQVREFSEDYTRKEDISEWGDSINFESAPVREFFLTNARYWIEEYHFDGLRVDATTWIFSSTPVHILEEITKVIKKAAGKKQVIVIGENEPQDTKLLKAYKKGGYGFDALWNDDFHHSAYVRLTGKREAYYTDYLGSTQEFISSLKYGFLYQGQYYDWQKKPRGTSSLHTPPASLVIFLENHDQVSNSGFGKRLIHYTDFGNYKALTCLLLLGPNTPMLFQGQEFGSSKPFYYFADHSECVDKDVVKGRIASLAQFPRLATSETLELLPAPADPLTFTKCKLDFKERQANKEIYALHKDLIHLKKNDPVFKKAHTVKIDGASLGSDSFLIRYFGVDGDRLIIINFGADYRFNPAPEPLLVPGENLEWKVLWSTESPQYGGEGIPPINVPYWRILGHSAIVLGAVGIEKKSES